MNQHDPAFKEYLQSPSWSICQPQKLPENNKALYNFKSGITGDQILTAATIFSSVQQYFARQNTIFTESFEKTKDDFIIFYENGARNQARLTYKFDKATGEYNTTPSETLKKERIGDVNIRGGTSGLHLVGDVRISTSQELKYPQGWKPSSGSLEYTRFKERYKYHFQYMVFDLTKTTQVDKNGKQAQEPSYEIEVEVNDLNHFISNMGNFLNFNRIIRRYLQNVASVQHLIARIKSDLQQKQAQAMQNPEPFLVEYEKQSQIAYGQYYREGAPKSIIVGSDYLASIAYREARSSNGEDAQ